MRITVPVLVLAAGLWAWAQQPKIATPAPPVPKLTPEMVLLRQQIEAGLQTRIELEVRRALADAELKQLSTSQATLQQALQQARMDSRQEIEGLRREVQSLQQAVWTLQSRVRD